MKVLKFGGTSVGSVESLRNVKKIVEAIPDKAVIVVSALGGLTDKLIATAHLASENNEDWREEMAGIRQRHHIIIKEVVREEKQSEVLIQVDKLLDALERNYEGVALLGSLPEKTLDIIVSFGERISSFIVASMIEKGKRYYSPDFIKTEKRYGKNVADRENTDSLIRLAFNEMSPREKAIVPGFISMDSKSGEITNLGRGGSDFTGALIAAALDAEVLEIWTDVDGFMTSDPRVVKDALIINHLTFTESMELCNFGAKVIYPPTIYPVFHKNIPIKILNTFNPTAPGTLVTDDPYPDDFDVKGVSALKNISLITVEFKECNRSEEFMERGLSALSKQGIGIIPLSVPEPYNTIYFAVSSSEAKQALDILNKEFAPEKSSDISETPKLTEQLTAVAIVGKSMLSRTRLAARLSHSLMREGIDVVAYSDNSDTTLIYIINQEKTLSALPLIHSLLY